MAQSRRKRPLPDLPPAPSTLRPTTPVSQKEVKAQKRKDRLSLNYLKMHIQPIMNEIKKRYRKFRVGVIDEKDLRYLFDEEPSESPPERPYEKAVDKNGEPGLKSVASGKFFYNLDITIIERRLSNGYYKRARDFLADIKRISKDAKTSGDEERILRANELQNNVEVDMHNFEVQNPVLVAELEAVAQRELQRERDLRQKSQPEPSPIEGPDLSIFTNGVDSNSQMADTVGNTQPSSGSLPCRVASPGTPPAVPDYHNNEAMNEHFLEHCVAETAQCTVEQMEQIYSHLMRVLWDMQGEWDRETVSRAVQRAFDTAPICTSDMAL